MSEELNFASSDRAIQYLANMTGKRILIADTAVEEDLKPKIQKLVDDCINDIAKIIRNNKRDLSPEGQGILLGKIKGRTEKALNELEDLVPKFDMFKTLKPY